MTIAIILACISIGLSITGIVLCLSALRHVRRAQRILARRTPFR